MDETNEQRRICTSNLSLGGVGEEKKTVCYHDDSKRFFMEAFFKIENYVVYNINIEQHQK